MTCLPLLDHLLTAAEFVLGAVGLLAAWCGTGKAKERP